MIHAAPHYILASMLLVSCYSSYLYRRFDICCILLDFCSYPLPVGNVYLRKDGWAFLLELIPYCSVLWTADVI